MTTIQQALVIGLGNECRNDDAVGRVVASKLKSIAANGIQIMEASGEGVTLMEMWKDASCVILIDATNSGGQPGTIHRMDAQMQTIPSDLFHYSSHAFGVGEAIELARALDCLPPRLVVYGIEGENFEMGKKLSPEVEAAANEVTRLIKEELCTNSLS